ncbi:MAG: hypothetical protein NZL91_07375 [Thermoflexales bacterium]|nr:hypothetical protein [Thermoflexales bacterium]MCS7325385.1 hypothetical protein [Thermoflexales bacterium]MCX7937852.1 hypothetical protein [Thermoflexales bacterium]MDW8053007.1 hypothetical protein [Anaerolineae bacterium]MDW8291660.1 hypothetical protein [Anaerolineae bacterium]
MAAVKPMIVKVKFFVNNEEVGTILLSPKEFRTGSVGFYGNGKLSLGDDAEKGYQAQVQLVRIGSKAEKDKREEETT